MLRIATGESNRSANWRRNLWPIRTTALVGAIPRWQKQQGMPGTKSSRATNWWRKRFRKALKVSFELRGIVAHFVQVGDVQDLPGVAKSSAKLGNQTTITTRAVNRCPLRVLAKALKDQAIP
jgi:hypothetical protein